MEENKISDYELLSFYESLSNWGSGDVYRAIEVYKEVGKRPEDLSEEITNFMDSCGINDLSKIDVCYIAYDSILQEARNKISDLLNFDFLNDGAEIGTYGNYLCTSYDFKEEAINKLKEVLSKATDEQKTELSEDKATNWFLSQIDLIESISIK